MSLVNVVFWLLQRDTTVYVEPSIFHRMTEVTACHLLLLYSGLPLVGRVRLRRAQMLSQLLCSACHRGAWVTACLLLLMHIVYSPRASGWLWLCMSKAD